MCAFGCDMNNACFLRSFSLALYIFSYSHIALAVISNWCSYYSSPYILSVSFTFFSSFPFFFFIIRNFSFCRWYLLLISHNEHSVAYTFFSLLSSVFKLTAFGCSLLSLFLSSFLVVYVAFAISVGVLYRNDFDDTGKTE